MHMVTLRLFGLRWPKNTILPVLALCMFSLKGLSQQNLFNVPSSDITLKKVVFFQQQFNLNRDVYQLNSTFCYGLGKDLEIGLNIIALNVNPDFQKPLFLTNTDKTQPPVYPIWAFNIQKAFVLNKVFKLSAGTQIGISSGGHFCDYSYLNMITILLRTNSKIITGAYYGNNNFLGTEERIHMIPGSPVGIQAGLEQTIIREKLLFIAENISGRHVLGEVTVGGAYYVSDSWLLSCGFQFANKGSTTSNALVLELTYAPSAVAHKKVFRHGHA